MNETVYTEVPCHSRHGTMEISLFFTAMINFFWLSNWKWNILEIGFLTLSAVEIKIWKPFWFAPDINYVLCYNELPNAEQLSDDCFTEFQSVRYKRNHSLVTVYELLQKCSVDLINLQVANIFQYNKIKFCSENLIKVFFNA